MLNHFLQLLHYKIHFFAGIMTAEREPDRYLVGIIVDGADNMRALVGAAGAGAAAAGADIIDVKVEQ